MLAGLGAGLAAGLGTLGVTAWAGLGRYRVILEQVVRRHVPDAKISADVLDAFYAEFWPSFERRLGRKRGLLLAALEFGRPLTDSVEPEGVEAAKREIVTAFLLGSNFFRPGPAADGGVYWIGLAQVCQNPFRRA